MRAAFWDMKNTLHEQGKTILTIQARQETAETQMVQTIDQLIQANTEANNTMILAAMAKQTASLLAAITSNNNPAQTSPQNDSKNSGN